MLALGAELETAGRGPSVRGTPPGHDHYEEESKGQENEKEEAEKENEENEEEEKKEEKVWFEKGATALYTHRPISETEEGEEIGGESAEERVQVLYVCVCVAVDCGIPEWGGGVILNIFAFFCTR
jgi:hypothetical protein